MMAKPSGVQIPTTRLSHTSKKEKNTTREERKGERERESEREERKGERESAINGSESRAAVFAWCCCQLAFLSILMLERERKKRERERGREGILFLQELSCTI